MPPSLALAAAVGCALCYGVGSVLEQVGARRETTATSIDPRLLLRLVRELPYVAGLALDGVGWVLSLLALRTLPLFLVQSAVASSIAVTAVVAWRVLGTRLDGRQVGAIVVILGGLVMLAVAAAPDSAGAVDAAFRAGMVVGVIVLGLAGAWLARSGGSRGIGLALVAGLAFGGTAVSARVVPIPSHLLELVRDPLTWTLVAYGVLGVLLFSIALQRGSVTVTNAVLFTAETVVPTLIGVVLLADRARNGLWPLMVVGLVATITGAVCLALWSEAAAQTAPGSPAVAVPPVTPTARPPRGARSR
jgi:drug/metabolite transporter (DMT)-like permease